MLGIAGAIGAEIHSPSMDQGAKNQGIVAIDLAENDLIQAALTGGLDAFNQLVISAGGAPCRYGRT